jgi:hypothetical protein
MILDMKTKFDPTEYRRSFSKSILSESDFVYEYIANESRTAFSEVRISKPLWSSSSSVSISFCTVSVLSLVTIDAWNRLTMTKKAAEHDTNGRRPATCFGRLHTPIPRTTWNAIVMIDRNIILL